STDRVPVIKKGSADIGGLLQDHEVVEARLPQADAHPDAAEPRPDDDVFVPHLRVTRPYGTTMTGQHACRASQPGTEPAIWCQKCLGAPITRASALNSAAIAPSSR